VVFRECLPFLSELVGVIQPLGAAGFNAQAGAETSKLRQHASHDLMKVDLLCEFLSQEPLALLDVR
jgi:hypothetical protein